MNPTDGLPAVKCVVLGIGKGEQVVINYTSNKFPRDYLSTALILTTQIEVRVIGRQVRLNLFSIAS